MREILFRGKCVEVGIYHERWLEGFYGEDDGKALISHNTDFGLVGYVCDPDTIGQYTGLKDRNGVKIFEGDIIKSEQDGMIGVIRFGEYQTTNSGNGECHLGFSIEWYGKYSDLLRRDLGWWVKFGNTDINIFGNIHDNPELLKGEQKNETTT